VTRSELARRLFAEYLGTALLVTAVVGSGIMAAQLSPNDVGMQLLENSITTMLALAVLILILGPISGAHFNPVVTLVDAWLHRRDPLRPAIGTIAGYVAAQVTGAISGAILANVMFGLTAVTFSAKARTATHLWIGEVVATAGLILLIAALVRSHRTTYAPAAVGAYIGAAYWFTSSTSFANPAVTIGRTFTNTFAGISPGSLAGFIVAQLIGAAVGLIVVTVLIPAAVTVTPETAAIDPAESNSTNRVPVRSTR
jgi:glycerol uptake facilitator-like aquaporin